MFAILRLSLRALTGRKRLTVLGLLVAVPAVLSFIYSFSSSTDNSDRSCPISWLIFRLGLSSSSIANGSS